MVKNIRGPLNGSVKADRILIGLSLIGLVVASLFLFNENLYDRFIGSSIKEDLSQPLMGVVTEKINDTRYKNSKTIMWVGAKKKQNIRLGDSLFTGEKSRSHVQLNDGNQVTLDENTLVVFNDNKLMDLGMGNFRFKVDGRLTFSVQGKPTIIEGKGSDIQIIVPKEKGSKPQIRLLQGKANLKIQGEPAIELRSQKIETLPIVIDPARATASIPEDEQNPQASAEISEPISTLTKETPVRRLQLYDVFDLKEDKSLVRKAVLDEEALSLSPLDETASITSSISEPVEINEGGIRLALSASGAMEPLGYVYEVSTSKDFPFDKTRAKWSSQELFVRLKTPGTYFYRVRGVNKKTEVTWPSKPVEVVVLSPVKVSPVAVNEEPRKLTPLTIRRSQEIQPRHSPRARIEKPIQIAKAKKTAPTPAPIRKPAAVASTSAKVVVPERTNQNYSSSRIDFESGMFTVFSPDEQDVGRKNPFAYTLGIRSKHWFSSRSGFEGIARVKAGGVNETANGINPLNLEARYHYRLPSSWFRQANFSLLTGLEVYRNIGRGYFAQQYDLAKLGFAVDFPVGYRWDMGGDVALGIGADQTKKYEAVGRLNYYFRKRYSLGVGYRLYLLEAGSEKTAPLDFPYRETWGEGFFVFRWHY